MAQIALKVGDIKFLKRFSVPIKSVRFDYGLEQAATFYSTSINLSKKKKKKIGYMKSECQFFNIKFEKTWRILPVLDAAVREIVCRLFSLSLKRES
jgi:hypothetical protein